MSVSVKSFTKIKAKKESVEQKSEKVLGKRQTDLVIVDPGLLSSTGQYHRELVRFFAAPGRILTVGDGDLSFSRCLVTELEDLKYRAVEHDGSTFNPAPTPIAEENLGAKMKEPRIFATTHDTAHELLSKYINAETCVATLNENSSLVLHSVDARDIANSFKEHLIKRIQKKPGVLNCKPPELESIPYSFGHIVFNFPHVGGTKPDDVDPNKEFLGAFFETVGPLLRKSTKPFSEYQKEEEKIMTLKKLAKTGSGLGGPSMSAIRAHELKEETKLGGQVHIAYKSTGFYDKVGLSSIAKSKGFALLRREKFQPLMYPGYFPQRTDPLKSEITMSVENSFVYTFVRSSPKSLGEYEKLREPIKPEEASTQADIGGTVDPYFLKKEGKYNETASSSEPKSESKKSETLSKTQQKKMERKSKLEDKEQKSSTVEDSQGDDIVVRKIVLKPGKSIKFSPAMREQLSIMKRSASSLEKETSKGGLDNVKNKQVKLNNDSEVDLSVRTKSNDDGRSDSNSKDTFENRMFSAVANSLVRFKAPEELKVKQKVQKKKA